MKSVAVEGFMARSVSRPITIDLSPGKRLIHGEEDEYYSEQSKDQEMEMQGRLQGPNEVYCRMASRLQSRRSRPTVAFAS